jgi:hypothetical protein
MLSPMPVCAAAAAPAEESADDDAPSSLFSAASFRPRLPPSFLLPIPPNRILAQVNRGSRSRGGVSG